MATLKELFHKPDVRTIAGVDFTVYKIAFEQFDDALLLGAHIASLGNGALNPTWALHALKEGMPERDALERLLAGCLAVVEKDGTQRQLKPEDIRAMPAVTAALAIAEVLEINADFFLRNLPNLSATISRLTSIGSVLPSSLSAPGTTPATSLATASPSSEGT